jgi:hypothetical protein
MPWRSSVVRFKDFASVAMRTSFWMKSISILLANRPPGRLRAIIRSTMMQKSMWVQRMSISKRSPVDLVRRIILRMRRVLRFVGIPLFLSIVSPARAEETLSGHSVVLDESRKLLSWLPQETAYHDVLRLGWDFMLQKVVTEDNGLPSFLSYCCIDGKTRKGYRWPHNPAGLNAMMVDGAVGYQAYFGKRDATTLVKRMLDHQLVNGSTPASWSWGGVPYASAEPGEKTFRGAYDFGFKQPDDQHGARGDGYGVIEPDKIGELGYGYLKFWKLTGDRKYLNAALACAVALATHVRTGDATRSPWPFRVYAESNVVREEYSASITGPLRLLDEVIRLKLGKAAQQIEFKRARKLAWEWTLAFPMMNNEWGNYFEDIAFMPNTRNWANVNPFELARYLLERPDLDSDWQAHAGSLIAFGEKTFGADTTNKNPKRSEKGMQWGARAISEQSTYMYKMASHTSRYAQVKALWYERTGDPESKEAAFRSFNWASYMCDKDGLVTVGPIETSIWFTDGYGDFLRHYVNGMAAVPEWAPPHQDHLLRSTSIVQDVSYAKNKVGYRTFDKEGIEVLRLGFAPRKVIAGKSLQLRTDLEADGYTLNQAGGGDVIVRIRRTGADKVIIDGSAQQ